MNYYSAVTEKEIFRQSEEVNVWENDGQRNNMMAVALLPVPHADAVAETLFVYEALLLDAAHCDVGCSPPFDNQQHHLSGMSSGQRSPVRTPSLRLQLTRETVWYYV
jgi:hypothetical protein